MSAGEFVKTSATKILWKLGLYDSAVRLAQFGKKASVLRDRLRDRWLRLKGAPDRLPIPPPNLVFDVAGSSDVKWFLYSGGLGAECIHEALRRNKVDLPSVNKVLDLGCGCGRVIRHLNFLPDTKLFGTDYNPKLVEWCRDNLPLANFAVNQSEPPLSYANDAFDLVYALSVFTHLTEQSQLRWMDELGRIIRTGGLLLITAHGEYYLNQLSPAEQARFQNGELVVTNSEVAGSNYCGAYHPTEYVRTVMARGFEIVDFIAEGAKGNPFQDLYLLRRKPD